jgi:hypothetical protein
MIVFSSRYAFMHPVDVLRIGEPGDGFAETALLAGTGWERKKDGSACLSLANRLGSDTGNGADKKDSGFFLSMGIGVAARAERDQVVFGVVARVTPKLLVMHLQV